MKICTECGEIGFTLTRVPNYQYIECGLDNVFLDEVEIRTCDACGETFTRIYAMGKLHRALALRLISKGGGLRGQEIRFLRKSVGFNGKDFARALGVGAQTVSRWENDKEPMGATADRMLRLIVKTHDHEQPLEQFDPEPSGDDASNIVLSRKRSGWQADAALHGTTQ